MTFANLRGTLAAALLALPAPALANDAAGLIRQFYAAVDADRPDPAVYGAMLAQDFVDNDRPGIAPPEVSDRDVTLALFAELEQAFPDAVHRFDILEPIGIDHALVYWTFEGTHTGPFFGTPASGREVSINGVDIFRTEGGKFVEQWHVEELQSLFAQIAAAEYYPGRRFGFAVPRVSSLEIRHRYRCRCFQRRS
jgi:hypothetical protein